MMKTPRRYTLAATFAFVCLVVAAPIRAQTAPAKSASAKRVDLEGPRVFTPPDVTATKEDRKMDFVLFRFNVPAPGGSKATKGTQILFVYVGGAPGFPSDDAPKGAVIKGFINQKPTKTITWTSKTGGLCRETLFYTRRPDFARYLHFIYADLTPTEAKIADAIIASAEPGPRPPGNWPPIWPTAVNGSPLP